MDDTLMIGSRGDPVRELQSQLKVLGYFLADVSGDFDAATAKAVADFQTERMPASVDPESNSTKMAPGTFDEATSRALQDHLSLRLGALRCLGFLPDDGARSSVEELEKALRAFQASEHIATSGILDIATRRALSNQIAEEIGSGSDLLFDIEGPYIRTCFCIQAVDHPTEIANDDTTLASSCRSDESIFFLCRPNCFTRKKVNGMDRPFKVSYKYFSIGDDGCSFEAGFFRARFVLPKNLWLGRKRAVRSRGRRSISASNGPIGAQSNRILVVPSESESNNENQLKSD